MRMDEFTVVYEEAKKVNVVENEWFNDNMVFWLGLTEKQHKKMYELLIKQGAEEKEQNGKTGISFSNGIFLYKL